MRKILLLLLSCCTLTQLHAQVDSVYWNFTSATTGAPATNLSAAQFTCSNISANINSTSASSGYSGASGGNNIVLSAPGGELNTSSSAYIEWTITPKSALPLGATSIKFGMRSTSSGARAWSLRWSKDAYASDLAKDTSLNDTKWRLHAATLNSSTDAGEAVTFRLYFYNGTGSGAGNTRIDDIVFGITPPMLKAVTNQLHITTSQNTPSSLPVTLKAVLLEQNVTVTSTNPQFTVDKSSISHTDINAAPQLVNVSFSGLANNVGKIVFKTTVSGTEIADTVYVQGEVGTAMIDVSPSSVDFASISVGGSAYRILEVTGAYLNDSIYVNVVAGNDVFSASPNVLYKAANKAVVTVCYDPESEGSAAGTIRFSSANALNVDVAVTGVATALSSAVPPGYYNAAVAKRDTTLKTALHNIIKGHTELGYDWAWVAFRTLDVRPECPHYTDDSPIVSVWDIYTDRPECLPDSGSCTSHHNPPGPCYNFKALRMAYDQQGAQGAATCMTEGCVYNREHSFPKSWWNNSETGTGATQHNDLHHLYPVDGGVNSLRNNWPYGEVANPSRETFNGGKFGPCTYNFPGGYTGSAFEPIDEYKGDLARTYFYMATRYEDEFDLWGTYADAQPMLAANKYPGYKPWAVSMLLKWHKQDPVSAKEVARNDSIYYKFQRNRNPFIDFPELAEFIWGDSIGKPWKGTDIVIVDTLKVLLNTLEKKNNAVEISVQVVNAKGGIKSVQMFLGASQGDTTLAQYTLAGYAGVYTSTFTPPVPYETLFITVVAYDGQGNRAVLHCGGGATGILSRTTNKVDFSLYPNPTRNEVHVQLNSSAKSLEIELFSSSGIKLHSQRASAPAATISLRGMPEGIYFVRVITKKGAGVRRFSLER